MEIYGGQLKSSTSIENLLYSTTETGQGPGSSFTIDWNQGNNQTIILDNINCAVNFGSISGDAETALLTLRVVQDSPSRTISTWDPAIVWEGGTPPVLSTSGGAVDLISFYYSASGQYWGSLVFRSDGASVPSQFISGTKIWFYQDTAPVDWTIDGGAGGAVLAVKGASGAYFVSGGTQAGTWTQPNHLHAVDSHTHTVPRDGWGVYIDINTTGRLQTQLADSSARPCATGDNTTGGSSGNTGNGATANTYRPFADVGIIASKD